MGCTGTGFSMGVAEMTSVSLCKGPGGLQQNQTCPAASPCPSQPRFISNLGIKPSSGSQARQGAEGLVEGR